MRKIKTIPPKKPKIKESTRWSGQYCFIRKKLKTIRMSNYKKQ